MAANFIDRLEVGIARALREIDRSAMLARHLMENPPKVESSMENERLTEDIRRTLVIRQSIIASGIELPDLRNIEDRGEPLALDSEMLTVSQIGYMFGLDRSTVVRRLRRMNGPIAQKWSDAQRAGALAIFTLSEAREIISSGEGE